MGDKSPGLHAFIHDAKRFRSLQPITAASYHSFRELWNGEALPCEVGLADPAGLDDGLRLSTTDITKMSRKIQHIKDTEGEVEGIQLPRAYSTWAPYCQRHPHRDY